MGAAASVTKLVECEVSKPLDASDMSEVGQAKNEVSRLRGLLAILGANITLPDAIHELVELEGRLPREASDIQTFGDARDEISRLRSLLKDKLGYYGGAVMETKEKDDGSRLSICGNYDISDSGAWTPR